jgi:hypothetical protein
MINRFLNRLGDTHPRAALALLFAIIAGVISVGVIALLMLVRGLLRVINFLTGATT